MVIYGCRWILVHGYKRFEVVIGDCRWLHVVIVGCRWL